MNGADTLRSETSTPLSVGTDRLRLIVSLTRIAGGATGLVVLLLLGILGHLWPLAPAVTSDTSLGVCDVWQYVMPSQATNDLARSQFASVSVVGSQVWFAGLTHDVFGKNRLSFARWDGKLLRADMPLASDVRNLQAEDFYGMRLWDLAVRNPTDAWAVGQVVEEGLSHPLLLHWDGQIWHRMPVPPRLISPSGVVEAIQGESDRPAQLEAVAVLAEDDAWAVGEYPGAAPSKPDQTLILHWNGSAWAAIPSPNPSASGNSLNSIVAFAADNVYAFGYYLESTRSESWLSQPLVLHWDGKQWSIVAAPAKMRKIYKATLSLDASKALWVVGDASAELWSAVDGETVSRDRSWSVFPIAPFERHPGENGPSISALSALSAADVWAVGTKWRDYPPNTGSDKIGTRALVVHWDGSRWQEMPEPNPSAIQDLVDVTVAANGEIWVTGSSFDDEDSSGRGLVAHLMPCGGATQKAKP